MEGWSRESSWIAQFWFDVTRRLLTSAFGIGVVVLMGGCASVEDLTHLSCTPPTSPSEVTLKREAYIYQIQGEPGVSLWDSPLRNGRWDAGQLILDEQVPLYTLAAGTQLTITGVTRQQRSGSLPADIIVEGTARIDTATVAFHYDWGKDSRVNYAPWESTSENTHELSRAVSCKPNAQDGAR
jgi:hypothetical protein